MSVGVKGGYDKKQSHTNIEEYCIPVEIVSVLKEQPDKDSRDIYKPQEIGYDKIFTKRYQVVQRKMDHMVGQVRPAFQPEKPGQVDDKIQNRPRVGIFF